MPPKDIKSLLDYLTATGQFLNATNNALAAWGPANAPLLGAEFLPPRPVIKNQDTITNVFFRTVAAQNGTRHSPAQKLDGGEIFGRIHYRLGNSDMLREVDSMQYDGICHYLNNNAPLQAQAKVIGIFDTMITQGLNEHDEIERWDAIVSNNIERRGDNGWYEYENGPAITNARVNVAGDWTDPNYDPWVGDILPRINYLLTWGYARDGIRIVTTDHVMQTLAQNPNTAKRLVGPSTLYVPQPVVGAVDLSDVEKVFAKLGVGLVRTYDRRIFTRTGHVRAYPEGNMTFIASTGRSEEVIYNQDDVSKVPIIIQNTLGFTGVGIANGQSTPARMSVARALLNQKDARIEFEGWQSTGSVIEEPTAIANIGLIKTVFGDNA